MNFPNHFVFMKVGTHAQEELADIIARKREEIRQAGLAMWGYGGNTCHPTRMIQPFAKSIASADEPIMLLMHPMKSRHFAEPVRAEEYSSDGIRWEPVPAEINVRGSRYALCIKSLERVDAELPLGATRVALGNSKGKSGQDYIRGRVDKACFDLAPPRDDVGILKIELAAEMVEPYAVFLRS